MSLSRRRCLRFVVVAFCAALGAGVFSQSSYAITWCFDWVAYEINGRQDTNRNSAATLRALLRQHNYTAILEVKAGSTSAAPRPQDIQLVITRLPPPAPQLGTTLRPGDVLIFKDFHTGIVRSSDGRFDHFLQIPGKTGTAYTPPEAAKLDNYFVGPEKSWTLQQFFAFSRAQPPSNTNDLEWATWREWLGRLLFGAPKQYPFLHSTAEVWRVVTKFNPAEPFAGRWTTFGGTGVLGLEAVSPAKGEKAVSYYSGGSANCVAGSVYYTGYYQGSSDSGQVAGCTDSTGRKLTGWYKSGAGPQHGTLTVTLTDDSIFKGSYRELSGQEVSGAYDGTRTG